MTVVRRLKEELNLEWDSKFSDLNLDSILNLVLLPKNFKMENHENHAPRAIARIKCRNSCTGTMMQLHGTCQLNLWSRFDYMAKSRSLLGWSYDRHKYTVSGMYLLLWSVWKLTFRCILRDLGILYPSPTAIQLDDTAPTGKHLCTQDRGAETAASDRERWWAVRGLEV